ncbi:MAG: hypothetical protein H7123_05355 [Thermoleophilia bacterium]|nr:hypothetical protein [Thermoleophilia bacterium]
MADADTAASGVRGAAGGARGPSLFTAVAAGGELFVVIEREDHAVIAGPGALVETICGQSLTAALAEFREQVEDLEVEGEPPQQLVDAAQRYGFGSRRTGRH